MRHTVESITISCLDHGAPKNPALQSDIQFTDHAYLPCHVLLMHIEPQMVVGVSIELTGSLICARG
jgi:hypothetical protein